MILKSTIYHFQGITEGVIKLWCPKVNASKVLNFIEELKLKPESFLEGTAIEVKTDTVSKVENIEAQYQTVTVRKKEQMTSTSITVEELLKKIVPPKSFLYRNQPKPVEKAVSSYVPMDAGTPKKSKKFFRINSYEYPHFDMKHFRMSKNENFNDRGYYSIRTNNKHKIEKTFKKQDRTKYKTLSTAEELTDMFPEEHFYEDLNYADNDKDQSDLKEMKPHSSNVKSSMVKIQEMFQSFKLPFFKKGEDLEGESKLEDCNSVEKEGNGHIYENSDSLKELYDTPKTREPLKDQVSVSHTLLVLCLERFWICCILEVKLFGPSIS